MRKLGKLSALALAVALAAFVAGCGSGGSKEGGVVTLVDSAGGVDSLDPGYWYYQTDYTEMWTTTQRALYGWKPEDTKPTPDLATGLPQVADGGKKLTINIKSGIKYSAPLANRTVAAADIKYAMERCFLPAVGNGYANTYYSDITGAKDFAAGKAKEITGLKAVSPTTLEIDLDKPVGVLATANALALPCTTPVPKDYASKYDQGKTSTYGQHQVFTGPYMVKGAGSGTIGSEGYQPGKSLDLVRNPSWDKATDYRPAHFNEIKETCCTDTTVASRQVLSGQSLMSGDFAAPPPAILKELVTSKKSQALIAPSQGNRYISFNTKIKPLDNADVRKALIAATDRTALRQTRGGPTIGTLATHFIPPEMPGFDEAGGNAGPGYDFFKSPTANLPLAQSYMKKAGYASGTYNGPALLAVADNQSPAKETAEAWQAQIGKLGFKLNLREVPHATMLQKFCNVPKAAVAFCPNLGWGKDFFDSQSMIDPIYNGKNIVPSGNVNTAQVNVPAYNKQMDQAETVIDPAQRATAWGNLDKTVTGQAYYDVWLWDNQVNFMSTNVDGVKSKFNSDWDLSFSSLK